MLITPALEWLRQNDRKFKASMSIIKIPCLKKLCRGGAIKLKLFKEKERKWSQTCCDS